MSTRTRPHFVATNNRLTKGNCKASANEASPLTLCAVLVGVTHRGLARSIPMLAGRLLVAYSTPTTVSLLLVGRGADPDAEMSHHTHWARKLSSAYAVVVKNNALLASQ